jgi:hypothetical protein
MIARSTFLSLVIVAPVAFAADEDPPTRPSARLLQEIRSVLPAYDPAIAASMGTPGTDLAPTPDILQLEKVTVTERVEQRIDPDQMLSKRDLLSKQKRAYLSELGKEGGLTRLLNSFHIPIVTPSVGARARAHYQAQKTRDLASTIDAIGELDPAAARELRKELSKAPDRASLDRK